MGIFTFQWHVESNLELNDKCELTMEISGGPRACLGQQFALTEVGYVVVRLLQRFDKLDGSVVANRKIRHGLTLANTPYGGVQVRLHSAAHGDLKA